MSLTKNIQFVFHLPFVFQNTFQQCLLFLFEYRFVYSSLTLLYEIKSRGIEPEGQGLQTIIFTNIFKLYGGQFFLKHLPDNWTHNNGSYSVKKINVVALESFGNF